MQNWRKSRNYGRYKQPDGTFTYVITIDGEAVPVSREIYRAYATADRQMEYIEHDLKRNRLLKDASGKAVLDENGQPVLLPEREVSLDKLKAEGRVFRASTPSAEDMALDLENAEVSELYRCIALLESGEQALIAALFFDGFTERTYAEKLGISKTALHARKLKVLEKIKNLLDL